MTDDYALVHQAHAGDMDAVERLYARFGRVALWAALKAGAGDDAEDVVQELFARLCEGRWHVWPQNGHEHGALSTLIVVMTTRLTQERAWRAKYWGGFPDDDHELRVLWRSPDETPEQRTLRREREQRLRAAFASLPQRQREVAILRYIEALNCQAIADRLGMRETQIPPYLARIREKLRPALATVYALPPEGRHGYMRITRGVATTGKRNQQWRRRHARHKARLAAAQVRPSS